jgi:pimeloyl-ACP methyl ester carboxylesterase
VAELAFDRSGSGAPLLLIHGIGARRGTWAPVVAALGGERDAIAPDLPGFGDSPALPEETAPSVEELTNAVAAFVDGLGLERAPDVVGNSLGGGIALELARRGVVAAAVALSPIGFASPAEARYGVAMLRVSRHSARRLQPFAARLVRLAAGRAAIGALYFGHPARVAPRELLADVTALAQAPGFDATLRAVRSYRFEDGAAMRVPVTIGWGTRDRLLPPRQAGRARLALPQARHVALDGCGHVPMPDDPDAIAALLRVATATAATTGAPAGSRA